MRKERREAEDLSRNFTGPSSRPARMEHRHAPRTTADDDHQKLREWEEAMCSICREPPHNAVLLQCPSPGCRPYICNTGARHSNCLQELYESALKSGSTIACPLCRGLVHGWDVIDSAARKYMNSKPRSCFSSDECNLSGTYAELRRHVRSEHPYAKPREVEPSRQDQWEALEEEMMIADLLEAVLSEENQGIGDNRRFVYMPIQLMTLLREYDVISSLPSGQV